MRLIQNDEMKAFEVLYDRYRLPLFSYLGGQISGPIAEEIMQDIFVKFLGTRHSFRFESKVKTWLWSITRNTLIDHWRSAGRKIDQSSVSYLNEEGVEYLESPFEAVELQFLKKSNLKQLEECLEELPPQQKEALLLYTQSDFSQEELAKLLKTTVSAIKSLVFRAKDKLLKCFKAGGHL